MKSNSVAARGRVLNGANLAERHADWLRHLEALGEERNIQGGDANNSIDTKNDIAKCVVNRSEGGRLTSSISHSSSSTDQFDNVLISESQFNFEVAEKGAVIAVVLGTEYNEVIQSSIITARCATTSSTDGVAECRVGEKLVVSVVKS